MAQIFEKDLTKEQADQIPAYKEKWLAIANCTEPMDLDKAIDLLGQAYDAAGFARPACFLWYASPVEGATVVSYLRNRFSSSFTAMVLEMEETHANSLSAIDALIDKFTGKKRTAKRAPTISRDQSAKLSELLLKRSAKSIERKEIRVQLNNAIYGQHEAGWLGFYEILRDFGVKECEKLTPLIEYSKVAGWAWILDEVGVITDRPSIFTRDQHSRPHNLNGPTLAYRNGEKYYAIAGVKVPPLLIEEPEKITCAMIEKEQNAEVRRVMLDRFGWARYVEESGAAVIDAITDKHITTAEKVKDFRLAQLYRNGLKGAKLYKKEIPGDEDLVMLHLINSTPERDGTSKPYLLRVDPKLNNCLDAIAWINDTTGALYRPMIET